MIGALYEDGIRPSPWLRSYTMELRDRPCATCWQTHTPVGTEEGPSSNWPWHRPLTILQGSPV